MQAGAWPKSAAAMHEAKNTPVAACHVAVAILCQPRGRAGGATGKVGHRRVPSALLNRMCELPLANSRRKHPLATSTDNVMCVRPSLGC